jgi:hypothetical protein
MTSNPAHDLEAAPEVAEDEDLAGAFAPAEEPDDEVVVLVDEAQAQGLYCNLALVASTETELGIDFAFAQHRQATAKLHARILLSPRLARRLVRSLEGHLAEYERRHGAIGD